MLSERFTNRMKPYSGESLYSFMLRFSTENGMKTLSFWNILKPVKFRYAQFDDCMLINFAPLNVIDPIVMSKAIGLSKEDIYRMSFYYCLNRFCGDNDIGRSRFISGILREEYYFCHKCLNETPCHKLIWSVKGINICANHLVPLTNKCIHCGKVILLKEVIDLTACPHCHSSLNDKPLERQINDINIEEQLWYYSSIIELLMPNKEKILPSNLAIKILYAIP